jgi:serine/threonine protein kinase
MRGTYEVDTTCSQDISADVASGVQGKITLCTEEVELTYEMSIDTISQLSKLRREGRQIMILNPDNRNMEEKKLFCFISSSMWSDLEFLRGLNLVAQGRIRTKTITKRFTDGQTGTAEEQYRSEIACYDALFNCPSPFLSRAVGADPKTHTIKMERMAHDLLSHIHFRKEINHINLLSDMLNGLEALRIRGYAHRDIKTENVLYDDITGVFKLTDFGLSERIDTKQRSVRGTPGFILPKRTHIAEGKNWGQANDKYAIGVTAWVAKKKKFPYNIPNDLSDADTPQHWTNVTTFMNSIQDVDDADMRRIAAYFKHEVLPMIDIGETNTAFRRGTKRRVALVAQ